MSGIIYLVSTREEDVDQNVYKVGRTSRTMFARMKGYSPSAKCWFEMKVDNHIKVETMVIRKFKVTFINRRDLGKEYFEGDRKKMIAILKEMTLGGHYSETVRVDAEKMSVDTPKKRGTTFTHFTFLGGIQTLTDEFEKMTLVDGFFDALTGWTKK